MDALLMCGGKGTRLESDAEKPLFEVGGRRMVDRVHAGLSESGVDAVYAVVSPHAPATRDHAESQDWSVVETPGEGYVADLGTALSDPRIEPPVLTAVADLPLLAGDAVDATLAAHDGGSMTVAVPTALKELLGASVDATFEHEGRTVSPAGVNVVAGTDERDGAADGTVRISHDARLAINVNRRSDAVVADRLLG